MTRLTIAQIEKQHAGEKATLQTDLGVANERLAAMQRERDRAEEEALGIASKLNDARKELAAERETSAMLRGYIHASIPVKLADLSGAMKDALGIRTYD